jgi:hypothetical protein
MNIATEIVTIPRRMHSEGKSPFTLLKETGYFELHDQISVSDIREALARDPACVQEWMQSIDDQRCSSSWYFVLNDEGLYEVGFYDSNTDPARSNQVVYENAMHACAAFIKHQIESIRSL